jgi:hypothetical protein
MNNPNVKLLVEVATNNKNRADFTLYKGALLDVSIISPKRLIELHNETYEDTTSEEKAHNQALKGVMGECTKDISGKCTLSEVVELIRAVNHKQEVKLVV